MNQKAVLIGQRDTALDVFRKIVPIARLVLENSLDSIKRGKVPRIAQDESKATCFGA